jgi:hypothetical protein
MRASSSPCPGLSLGVQEPIQPEPSRPPLALDRREGDLEVLGDLLEGEPIEEVELHDAGLPRIELLQPVESLIEGIDLGIPFPADPERLVERRIRNAAPPFRGPLGFDIIQEDPPHEHLRHGEKLLPVLPLDALLSQELGEELVDQSRRLERLRRPAPQEAAGDPAEVVEDLLGERLQGGVVAAAPGLEEVGEVGEGG